ncbi:MAG: hypothetical protein IPL62_10950, partial [Caulobacteraceae bacterium]|nr:hypothetical protein [Caulobacteraceae bacterium]
MRTPLIALALLAAACSPAPSQSTGEVAATTTESAPVDPNAAALGATPQTGAWTLRTDEGTTAAGFGAPESEYLSPPSREAGSGKLTLIYEHEARARSQTRLCASSRQCKHSICPRARSTKACPASP